LMRSIAREYGWKYVGTRGAFVELMLTAKLGGTDAVLQKYDELKGSGDAKNRPPEFALNALGYDSLANGKTDDAIRIFQKNVEEFPDSSNVYDSLGEAYAAAGKKELATENYERAIKLDPKNQNAIERLKKLKDQK
jgi:tetratricopeptide (TPR) repeat protein